MLVEAVAREAKASRVQGRSEFNAVDGQSKMKINDGPQLVFRPLYALERFAQSLVDLFKLGFEERNKQVIFIFEIQVDGSVTNPRDLGDFTDL